MLDIKDLIKLVKNNSISKLEKKLLSLRGDYVGCNHELYIKYLNKTYKIDHDPIPWHVGCFYKLHLKMICNVLYIASLIYKTDIYSLVEEYLDFDYFLFSIKYFEEEDKDLFIKEHHIKSIDGDYIKKCLMNDKERLRLFLMKRDECELKKFLDQTNNKEYIEMIAQVVKEKSYNADEELLSKSIQDHHLLKYVNNLNEPFCLDLDFKDLPNRNTNILLYHICTISIIRRREEVYRKPPSKEIVEFLLDNGANLKVVNLKEHFKELISSAKTLVFLEGGICETSVYLNHEIKSLLEQDENYGDFIAINNF